ncbi:hypothetical protein G7081_03545 [Vagococcus coleopterorum]|uniref:Uncharacterized protein n=1 Tax=Vagococcus coleopterorum TaxID=2714946 RepID=A0A6G8AMA6_9ENTE|nr:helix-turn-helix domain-containing protein [Vagococcus coleopterorum]QIL46211.1 hypothetical protein G7081_03545 [Vagococcus coleopterorum]
MILDILESNDRVEMLIVMMLEQYNNHVLTANMVCSELNISNYKLEQHVKGINQVLENNEVKIDKEGILIYGPVTTNRLEKLKQTYIMRSKKFHLLQYILDGGQSMPDFSKKAFLSIPQSYRLRLELASFLKNELNIELNSMELIAPSELALRNSLYDLYFFYFSGFDLPFSNEVREKYLEIKKMVQAVFTKRIPKTQGKNLKLFICIQLTRVLSNKNITSMDRNLIDGLITMEKTDYYFSQAMTNLGLSPDEQVVLIAYIQLNIQKADISVVKSGRVQELIEMFELTIKEQIKKDVYANTDIVEESAMLFANWLIFSNKATSFIEEAQIGYFCEMYPTFHSIAHRFVDVYCRNLLPIQVDNSQLAKYYYDLIFLLIQEISLHEIEPIINICVDFSHGSAYNMFIKRNIENYKDLNINLQESYNGDTDLYLTDIYLPNIKTDKIIWRDPPTVNDWGTFADKVLLIKESKVEKD